MSLFLSPIEHVLRHSDMQRKAESWPTRATASAAAVDALELPSFDFAEVYGRGYATPLASFAGCEAGMPQHFILCRGEDRFLIDTQGYDYARYIARIG